MALYAMNRFPGDGSTTSYEFNFVGKYLARNHVRVYQENDGTKERTYIHLTVDNFLNDTTLAGLPATPVGSTLVIYRDTPKAPLVDFVNGSRFTEHNLDLVARQGLFVATEALVEGGNGGGGGYSIPLPMPEANKLLGWNGTGTELVNYAQPSGGVSGPAPDLSAYVTKTQLAGVSGASMVGMLNGSTPSTVGAVIASLRADIAANRIIVTNDAAFNSLLVTSSLSADHFYVIKDTEKVYFATAGNGYFTVGGGSGGGTGVAPSAYPKVAFIGDSMIAQQPLLGDAWPTIWAQRMATVGAKVDMHNFALGGWTFNKALTLKPYANGTKTMIQAAIDVAPDVVFVQLGANDMVLNIEGRTLAQVKSDAEQVFQQLRTDLPNATIVYIGEIMYDAVMFPNPGSVLKNKGVGPYMMQRPTSGILSGCYSSEMLDDSVSAATKADVANWVSMDSHVATLSTVNAAFRVNQWRATRLGGCGTDGVHLTQAGNKLLAAYALRSCSETAALRARWPTITDEWYNSWSHPDILFTDLLTQSGDGWVERAYAPAGEFVATTTGDFRDLTPSTWYLPSKGVFRVGSTNHPADPTYPTYWSLTGGPPLAGIQLSVNGAAFAVADASSMTDALGNRVSFANGAALPPGTATIRWKCGSEVYGPITITTTAYTAGGGAPEPHLEVFSTNAQYIPDLTITEVLMGNVEVNRGAGSWNSYRYTVPKTGRYQISGVVSWNGGQYNIVGQAYVYVGEVCRAEGSTQSGQDFFGSSVSATLLLNAGDQVGFRCFVSTGRSAIPGSRSRSTSATISYIGA